jgi:hypothetical protein
MNKEEVGIIINNLELLIDRVNKDYDRSIQELLTLLDRLKIVAKD